MIVGGYVLHLYCDFEGDKSWEHTQVHSGQRNEFGGSNHTDSIRYAKKLGWKFHSDGHRVLCPYCVKLDRKLPRKKNST